MDPEDDNGIYNIGIGGNLGVVAGTSPPSSPLADGDDVLEIARCLTDRMGWGSLDLISLQLWKM